MSHPWVVLDILNRRIDKEAAELSDLFEMNSPVPLPEVLPAEAGSLGTEADVSSLTTVQVIIGLGVASLFGIAAYTVYMMYQDDD